MKECAVNRDQAFMAENQEGRNAACGIKLRHFRTDDRVCFHHSLSRLRRSRPIMQGSLSKKEPTYKASLPLSLFSAGFFGQPIECIHAAAPSMKKSARVATCWPNSEARESA